MQITVTKAAKKDIATFSMRESKLYEYALQLCKSDWENFKAIDIATRAGDNTAKVLMILMHLKNLILS